MKKKQRALKSIADEQTELEITPMIDVTFLLLIFFMCTLKFKVLEGALEANLPKDVGAGKIICDAEPFKIQLRVLDPGKKVAWDPRAGAWAPYTAADAEAGRRFEYDGSRVIEYTYAGSNTTTDLAVLQGSLEAVRDVLGSETRVQIDPRPRTCQGDVVEVLDVVLGLEISQVTFAGSHEN